MEVAARMMELNESSRNFVKIGTIFEKIQSRKKITKINGATDCKFEFEAVQRNPNLVDLEKCCKIRLFSLSQLSIQPRTSPLKFGSQPTSDPPPTGVE